MVEAPIIFFLTKDRNNKIGGAFCCRLLFKKAIAIHFSACAQMYSRHFSKHVSAEHNITDDRSILRPREDLPNAGVGADAFVNGGCFIETFALETKVENLQKNRSPFAWIIRFPLKDVSSRTHRYPSGSSNILSWVCTCKVSMPNRKSLFLALVEVGTFLTLKGF